MFALPRYALPRPTSLCRSVASTIHGSPDGASLSSTSGSPSSSSTPRTPRPRRSNVPLVDVNYSRPHLDLVAQSVVYCLRLQELSILTLTPSARRPDPISNLRPILYRQTDTPPAPRNPSLPPRPQPVPRPSHHSPTSEVSLSLAEFSKPSKEDPGKVFYRKDEFPREGDESDKTKEYRVVRETLDEYNQAFWVRSILFSTALLPVSSMTDRLLNFLRSAQASSNTRYHLGLNAQLAKLTPSDPPTHADEEARIKAVDDWNANWLRQEGERQRKWMKEWWGGQVGVLKAWWAMKRESPI